MKLLRIATVPYLNIEPFIAALGAVVHCEVLRAPPSRLAWLYHQEMLDLCMLSTCDLHALRIPPLRGAGISADGPVRSVVVLSESAPRSWDRVVLDSASSTSTRLARLLLDRHARRPFRYSVVEAPEAALRRKRVDAALVIGDPALRSGPAAVRLDLAAIWRTWTGLPFVFAAWVPGRASSWPRSSLEEILQAARAESARYVASSARAYADQSALDRETLVEYLNERIS